MNNPIGVLINYSKGMDLVSKFREAQEMELMTIAALIQKSGLGIEELKEKLGL